MYVYIYTYIYIYIYISASPLGGNQAVRYSRLAFSLFPPPFFSLPRSLVGRGTRPPHHFRGPQWRRGCQICWHTQYESHLGRVACRRGALEVDFDLYFTMYFRSRGDLAARWPPRWLPSSS